MIESNNPISTKLKEPIRITEQKWDKGMFPLVSIVNNTYNHVGFIRDALEGFIMQKTTFKVEILVHDDASTDGTAAIVREYETRYPEIFKPVYQTENQYSKGIKIVSTFQFPRARGKYIALCEGDDYWTDPLKLQKQVDFLENNSEYSSCFHEAEIMNAENYLLRKNNNINEDRDFNILDLTQNNFICTASVVFRKKNIENLPDFFRHLHAADWGLHLINAKVGKIRYLKDCMSVYRHHSGGKWSSMKKREMGLKGVELMKQLDELLNYEYHEYFCKGIENRLKTFGIEDNTLTRAHIKKESFFQSMKQKLRIRTRIKKIFS